MKKQILTIAAFAGLSAASFAQDAPTSKNGYTVLPESGDYAIQMDATPILDFALNAVNIMNNTGNTAQHPGYVSGFGQTIVGKYFIADDQAIRGKVAINTTANSTKTYGDDPLTPTAGINGTAENILLETSRVRTVDILLAGGMEWRRGHNRLQGFYGGEVFLGFASSGTTNKYEIEYNQTAADSGYIASGSSRTLSDKNGLSITFGLRGFAGVEYFVLPKISIGAEFGWGFGITTNPRGSVETENWGIEPGSSGTTDAQYIETNEGNSSGSGMGFQVDDGTSSALGGSAALTATFHF